MTVLFICAVAGHAASLDSFDTLNNWKPMPADGVEMQLSQDAGRTGSAMRIDFDFHGHGGYAIARRQAPVDLPENFEFTFWMKGEAPRNTLEFKLISGENVWWTTRRDFEFPKQWQRIAIKKRQIEYAWGPLGKGEVPRHIDAIEIVVTAGTGGKGSVWIDDLTLSPVTITSKLPKPFGPFNRKVVTLDLGARREFGGMTIDRESTSGYSVALSQDGKSWDVVRRVAERTSLPGGDSARAGRSGTAGGTPALRRDWLYLPDADARYVRLTFDRRASVKRIALLPVALSKSPNDFFAAVAAKSPRGRWPRYLHGEQSYWTVVGEDRSPVEALLSEDGAVEAGNAQYSIEPFVWKDGRLITWNDVKAEQTLEQGYLPIPTVTWPGTLSVTAFADAGRVYVRYRVPPGARLYLAIRPLQVDPPWQFLRRIGGATKITSIAYGGGRVDVMAAAPSRIQPLTKPAAFGAATFDDGNIVDSLARNTLPTAQRVDDPFGYASAALAFDGPEVTISAELGEGAVQFPAMSMQSIVERWSKTLDGVTIDIPDRKLADSIRTNLAYILINRDGDAIQPGSRSYERSWIRDGSLTSTALLRLGHFTEVRDFINWYAKFQYPDGKIPCCVGPSGADPVPENDSQGEFIYLVAEYYRFTRDRALLESMWPQIARTAAYIDQQRHERMTPKYEGTMFYGLVPESISHEGYSAKPMHSYWDDFFALRGLKDAAYLAQELGRAEESSRYAAMAVEFRRDLLASIAMTMKQHRIDYIPGSAELGDFDATSTTIALEPGGEQSTLPQAALRRTFDKYFETALTKRTYTPYEWRTVGTFIRLGEKHRALELVRYFFRGQRPSGWNEWAEVVHADPRKPAFIGDMPHTWVGSDFIRSALDLFAYDRESEKAIVVGAGVPAEWLDAGIRIAGLETQYGPVSYSMKTEGDAVRITIDAVTAVPPGGIVVVSPLDGSETVVRAVPATLSLPLHRSRP